MPSVPKFFEVGRIICYLNAKLPVRFALPEYCEGFSRTLERYYFRTVFFSAKYNSRLLTTSDNKQFPSKTQVKNLCTIASGPLDVTANVDMIRTFATRWQGSWLAAGCRNLRCGWNCDCDASGGELKKAEDILRLSHMWRNGLTRCSGCLVLQVMLESRIETFGGYFNNSKFISAFMLRGNVKRPVQML